MSVLSIVGYFERSTVHADVRDRAEAETSATALTEHSNTLSHVIIPTIACDILHGQHLLLFQVAIWRRTSWNKTVRILKGRRAFRRYLVVMTVFLNFVTRLILIFS
jgi:hypothetical protein